MLVHYWYIIGWSAAANYIRLHLIVVILRRTCMSFSLMTIRQLLGKNSVLYTYLVNEAASSRGEIEKPRGLFYWNEAISKPGGRIIREPNVGTLLWLIAYYLKANI